ncbi:alpha-amylase family glycosyl hydrolase [Anaerosporobacter faecicola]|uniref:alpha-amylase family glycosyl hydrolase n=1 Tax=Anaerosporobacter faecicola TaxID=2718714 RepID=UPI001438F17B|nr:alpha-amylase family glycosyl hydrolase [Anaerosporobacter faecicola]
MKKMYCFKKQTRLLLILILLLGMILPQKPILANENTEKSDDASVTNTASFCTDVMYRIVTDRFFDGNTKNNPTNELFDKKDSGKYHGGDWAGITQKIKEGYFTGMGISALWISSPVENITSLDPVTKNAAYQGTWAKDYLRTNPYFGSIQEFKTMIDTAHKADLKVVIDFSPNATSQVMSSDTSVKFQEDGALYRDGKLLGSYNNDSSGLFNHETIADLKTYENGIYHSINGFADLNQQNTTIDQYMKDAAKKWLNLGVDGIHVDSVDSMTMGWQKNWLSSLYATKSVYVFGDWFESGTSINDPNQINFVNHSGMSTVDYAFSNALRNAFGTSTGTMKQLSSVVQVTGYNYEEVNQQVTFLEHDKTNRFMNLTKDNHSLEAAYVVLLTSRGIPSVYYGSEQYVANKNTMTDMPCFDTTSNAYQIIGALASLRKSNPALAYGTMKDCWVNDNVYIYERKFGDNVVVTAVNKSKTTDYTIANMHTNLPAGVYEDVLQGKLNGEKLYIAGNGSAYSFLLKAGESAVWQYTAKQNNEPIIGNVDPMIGITGNTVTITGRGFGTREGRVLFNDSKASIVSWSDSKIRVLIPDVKAGMYDIKVEKSNYTKSEPYKNFEVLSGPQVSVRFRVNKADGYTNSQVYVVGSIHELGEWDMKKAIGPFFCNTDSIGKYPTWFYDINVPSGTVISYIYFKLDNKGNTIWESGTYHTVVTPAKGTETFDSTWQK